MVGAHVARDPGQQSVAALVATKNRIGLLCERSLPSIRSQTHRPQLVVLVNDGSEWPSVQLGRIRSQLAGLELLVLGNTRTAGAGGAWNTGLDTLADGGFSGFVALLDDDDAWDAEHLECNLDGASAGSANIVVSGLRMRGPQGDIPRPLVSRLLDRDFLTGNPGWQGSNTVVDLALLMSAGGFRESLASLHDRDLAIRLLRHPNARPCLIPRWTATWYADRSGRLSDYRGEAKLQGLQAFWALYSGEMKECERHEYLARAERLFGFAAKEVIGGAIGQPVGGDA